MGLSHKGQEKQESSAYTAQTINYLPAMKIDYGMLINFGSLKFESRKLARPRPTTPVSPALCGSK